MFLCFEPWMKFESSFSHSLLHSELGILEVMNSCIMISIVSRSNCKVFFSSKQNKHWIRLNIFFQNWWVLDNIETFFAIKSMSASFSICLLYLINHRKTTWKNHWYPHYFPYLSFYNLFSLNEVEKACIVYINESDGLFLLGKLVSLPYPVKDEKWRKEEGGRMRDK